MPMSFPDFQSLIQRAEVRKFRKPNVNETEQEFRTAFADFMRDVDSVESAEIRSGLGCDDQSPEELLYNTFSTFELTNLKSPIKEVIQDDKHLEYKRYTKNLIEEQMLLIDLSLGYHEFKFDLELTTIEFLRLEVDNNFLVFQLNQDKNVATIFTFNTYLKLKTFFSGIIFVEQNPDLLNSTLNDLWDDNDTDIDFSVGDLVETKTGARLFIAKIIRDARLVYLTPENPTDYNNLDNYKETLKLRPNYIISEFYKFEELKLIKYYKEN